MLDLHRVGKRPDWELVAANRHNVWQRIAAGTKGVLTPANVASVTGAVLVVIGLWQVVADNLLVGFILIAVGRAADILDGAVAHATGTKSNVGEALDASIDKIVVIAALGVLVGTGIVPLLAAGLMVVRNSANITLSLLAKAHKKVLHPSRAGKLAGGLEWVSLLLFVLSAFAAEQASNAIEDGSFVLAYAMLGVTLALGIKAIKEYGTGTLDSAGKRRSE